MDKLSKTHAFFLFLLLFSFKCLADTQTLTGTFQILWGDPPPTSRAAPAQEFRLINSQADQSVAAKMDPRIAEKFGGILFLNGKEVRTSGFQDSSGFRVQSVQIVGSSSTSAKSFKVVNILCSFSNRAAPHPNSW